MDTKLTRIGQASANTEVLTLKVMDATVTVRHEEREDIAVHANYSEHWAAGTDGTVRQTAVRRLYSDVRVIIEVHGTSLGDLFAALWRRLFRRVPTTSAEIPSTTPVNPPAAAEAEKPQLGPDELLVLVPLNFGGKLDLDVEGSSDCEVDCWTGTSVKIDCGSMGKLTLGDIKVPGAFTIDHRNDGNVQIGNVEAHSIEASFLGDGNHELGNFVSEGDLSLTQENNTDVTVKDITGTDVTVSFTGDRKQYTGDITARGHLVLNRYGDGDLDTGKLQTGSAKIEATGDGTLDLGPIVCEGDFTLSQENSTSIDSGDITGGAVTIDLSGDYGFTAGNVTAKGRLVINRYGDGDLKTLSLAGEIIETKCYGNGTHDLGRMTGGTIKVEHDDGDCSLDMGPVQATSFTLIQSSDGEVEIARLDTTAINMDCYGEGNVTVRAGSAQSGRVYNGGDLYLSLTGRFGYISQKNDGDGGLEIEIVE